MDPLILSAFEALLESKTGDEKIDDHVLQLSYYFKGLLRKLDEGLNEIDSKKGLYSADGINHKKASLARDIKRKFDELMQKGGYAKEISDLRKSMTVPKNESELETLTRTLREIEIRGLMLALNDKDPIEFQGTFAGAIMDGDPLVISAIENSPVPLPWVEETMLKEGQHRRMERLNPSASQRLKTFEGAQATIEGLGQIMLTSLGEHGRDDLLLNATDTTGAG